MMIEILESKVFLEKFYVDMMLAGFSTVYNTPIR